MNIHRELELIVKAFEMSNGNKLISPIELSPIFEIFCCCSVDYFRAENLSDLKLNSHRIVFSRNCQFSFSKTFTTTLSHLPNN